MPFSYDVSMKILIPINYVYMDDIKRCLVDTLLSEYLIYKTTKDIDWWNKYAKIAKWGVRINDNRDYIFGDYSIKKSKEEERLIRRLKMEDISIKDLNLLCKINSINIPRITTVNKNDIIKQVKAILI